MPKRHLYRERAVLRPRVAIANSVNFPVDCEPANETA
jgi:hypothetical protein